MTPNDRNEEIVVSHYVVAYFDLLGQQDHLRNLGLLATTDGLTGGEKALETLKNTYGAVTMMRRFFMGAFDSFARRSIDTSELTEEQLQGFEKLSNNPIKSQRFSDSIVVFLSLRTDTMKLPERGVFGILAAAATTFVCCLAEGHPIRGGIDIGLGIEMSQDEIYGPALSRAYALESRIANYPRIVVGDKLLAYLRWQNDQQPTDMSETAAKLTAARCLECLAIDDDGHAFLDYLGPLYRRTIGGVIDAGIIQTAYHRVIEFSDRYQAAKNGKLASRYTLLRNYFEARLPLWQDLFQ